MEGEGSMLQHEKVAVAEDRRSQHLQFLLCVLYCVFSCRRVNVL